MFKLVLLFACVAVAAASAPYPSVLAYSGLPVASGYEYSASVATPDYVNHQSVSAPLAPSPYAYNRAYAYSGWPGAIRSFERAPIYRAW